MPKTVEEIARETGFSITTVRFVINGQAEKYRISEKTRKQIEEYVAIHGYSLNHAARSLKLKRSDTIGLVIPDLANAFFARFMAAFEIRCRKRNLLLLTVSSHDDPELESRAVNSLLARGVDGLVIAPCQASAQPQLIRNQDRKSIVMFDRDYGTQHFPTVVSDNYQGALEMSRRMLREAKGPCYFMCGDAERPAVEGVIRGPSIKERLRGFIDACAEAGIKNGESLVRTATESSPEAGAKMMHDLIDELGAPPSAFICSALLLLEGALQQIRTQTGKIDKKLLIGTFDDHTMLDFLPNRVLSIRQNEDALARRVFERLVEPLGSSKRSSAVDTVPTELICRNL